MKFFSSIFSIVLLSVFIFICPVLAGDLISLEAEAFSYSENLLDNEGRVQKPYQAASLLVSAGIMVETDNCSGAVPLYEQAVRYGLGVDCDFWLALAQANKCDSEWRDASRVAFLAYSSAENREQKIAALKLLAHSLEKRGSYKRNWNLLALEFYNRLLAVEDTAYTRQKIEALQERVEDLIVQRSFSKTGGNKPSLCLRFNDTFPEDNDIKYGDYIRITPSLQADFAVDGRKICIDGAEYGTEYSVVVRKGLNGTESIVSENQILSIQTGHRDPALWFKQNAYVLPKSSQKGIGLYSVNIDSVGLRLYRIHERNILSEFVQSKFRRKLDRNDLEKIGNSIGEEVWQGTAQLRSQDDVIDTSSLVLPDEVIEEPGLYIISAVDSNNEPGKWEDRASQWLVVTDVALTTYQGSDGLTVVGRSLASALPLSDLEVSLYARNNKPLSYGVTDQQGVVRFAPGLLQGKGGQGAMLLVAQGKDYGFTFLQLDQAAFDLSDRGVSGRFAPGPIDAYVYIDRGIYRPGETVNLVSLIRDQLGGAVNSPPLILHLLGPDGKLISERVLKQGASGSYTSSLKLADSARTGNWTAELYIDMEDKPVGKVDFQVQAFVPPRLEVRAVSRETLLPQSSAAVIIRADYLYGSPGSNLQVEGSMTLHHDPHPFLQYADFFFGLDGVRVDIPVIDLDPVKTDAEGAGVLTCTLQNKPSSLQPLKASILARVIDVDGRSVKVNTTLPVRHLDNYIGIKKLFPGNRAAGDSNAAFQVVTVGGNGELVGANLRYRLVEEEVDYQWFRKNGRWGYERIINDRELEQGKLDSLDSGPASLSLHVARGNYRLEIRAADSPVLALTRFTAGDQIHGRSNTPDAVKVELDKSVYKAGELARLRIKSPYAGEGSLVLAGTKVYGMEHFHIDSLSHELEIPVEASWGAGTYALITMYRPGGGKSKGAARAMGLVWISVDPVDTRLDVELEVPNKVRPRQTIEIPVTVRGQAQGEAISMTLAAVDDGVLQLTGYSSPDPLGYFFGKQQLGTEIKDLYGQLIEGPDSKPLNLRTGAGDTSRRGAAQSNVRVVSLFSGVVAVDNEGMAKIPLSLPDFNGRLRLMAVAWSKSKLGAISNDLQINDPVVVSPSLPRFLARGDKSSVNVLIENIEGPEGVYRVQMKADGVIDVNGESEQKLLLKHGQRNGLDFTVAAHGIGSGNLLINVSGPEQYHYSGEFALNARGKYLPILNRTFTRLEPGAMIPIDSQLTEDLYPGTAEATITLSSSPNLDVPGLLGELDRYPYGCLEQLTSRAMPLLYANMLALRWQYPLDDDLAVRISEAIDLILQKQRFDGSFGLWSSSSPPEYWLSSYAMEFLSRAEEEGYNVPDIFLNKGMEWLAKFVASTHSPTSRQMPALAYAHYVLARNGLGKPEDARYLFDNYLDSDVSALTRAHLSGALALQGDVGRAKTGFAMALALEGRGDDLWWSYGTRLRDLAGVINVLHESGQLFGDPAASWELLPRLLAKEYYLSTQEQAWLVMAALTLDAGKSLELKVNGKAIEKGQDFFLIKRSGQELNKLTRIRNTGMNAAWVSTTIQGNPVREPTADASGFSLDRSFHHLNGEPAVMEKVQQGEFLIVLLEGDVPVDEEYRALAVDLLPAGFEIEKSQLNTDQDAIDYSWLSELSPTLYVDALDDRYVAAFNTGNLEISVENDLVRTFRLAYLVRAVFPGSYVVSPAEIEDMYQPQYRARTMTGKVDIFK